MLSKTQFSELPGTLPAIAEKVQSMAYSFRNVLDPQDVEAGAWVKILERASADPEFLSQTPSYIVHAGRLEAMHQLRPAKIEEGVISYDAPYDHFDGDGFLPLDFIEIVAGDEINPEDALIMAEQASALADVLSGLSKRESEVLALIVSGKGTGEIASQFKCSPAAISCYKKRIAQKIQSADL